MNEITIRNKTIGKGKPVFIIAEIGINHNGSLDIAKKLIDVAKAADCDAVKFQKRTPEICVPENVRDRIRETPWGEMTYFEYKKRIEFGKKEYDEIDGYCRDRNILWTASAWDEQSVDFLESYDIPFHKVPSAHLTNDNLLKKMMGRPIILSTGMSTMKQIEHAVSLLDENKLVLLHCNSSYPVSLDEINLNVIKTFQQKFSCPIGYSGHETGIFPSVAAAFLGATVIERHITLDRAMWGTDQAASLEPEGLHRMVRDIRNIPKILGDGKKRVYESEKTIIEKLRTNQ
jgi:N-acetylneuraminate synthase